MLLVGCFTRTNALVVFLTLVSLHHRNPAILHSGYTLLCLLTLILVFSRAGAELSVDSLLFRESSERLASASPWAERLMQVQICVVYGKAGLWKLQGKSWREGTSIHYLAQVDSFRRFDVRPFMNSVVPVRACTWLVLAIELGFPICVWIEEFRYPILVAALVLHLSIEVAFNIQFFSWIMIASLLLYVRPKDIASIIRK